MSITEEIFNSLPEIVQANYEKNGDEYVTVDSLKVAALKGKLDGAYGERDKFKGDLTAAQERKAEEIKLAEEAAYKKAIAENNHEEQSRILTEKLADAERRSDESKAKFEARMQALAKDAERNIISELSALATDDGKAALKLLLAHHVKVDPETGAEMFLNDDGSASSLNKEQFISEVLGKNPIFKPLIKAKTTTTGGGGANGSQAIGSAFISENKAAESAKSKGDAIGTLNARLKEAFKI